MITVVHKALLLFVVISILIGGALYKITPRPHYVEMSVLALQKHNTDTNVVQKALVGHELERLKNHPSSTKIAVGNDDDADNQEDTAATVLSTLPVIYSVSAAFVLAWCVVLLIGCVAAYRVMHNAKRRKAFSTPEVVLINGVVLLTVTNIGLLVIGNSVMKSLMDSVVMWNVGMIVVLAYISGCLSNTKVYNCLIRKDLLIRRRARMRKRRLSKLNSSDSSV